jgi:hypothetical protein
MNDQTACAINKKSIVRLSADARQQLAALTRTGKAAAYKIQEFIPIKSLVAMVSNARERYATHSKPP